MSKIKLFCFPYAGGSAIIFHKWKQHLSPEIELMPIELAGRGKRFLEPWYKDRSEAVEDVFQLIKDDILKSAYILFGHSLGSLITYELVQKIRHDGLPAPDHIFFSGSGAPHLKDYSKKYHILGDEDFKKEVMNLGGTPPEFFDHPELVDIFLPLLKNDFRLAEAPLHTEEISPLDNNITVFLGEKDDLTSEQCEGWKKHTNQKCSLYYFSGGHFFIHEKTENIVDIINNTLMG